MEIDSDMNAHVGHNRPGGIKVSFASQKASPSEEADALLAALAPTRPKTRSPTADGPAAPDQSQFRSIRELHPRAASAGSSDPDYTAGDEIIESELRLAERDGPYVRSRPAAGPAEVVAPVEPADRPGYHGASDGGEGEADEADERDAGMKQILSEDEIDRELKEESEKHGRSRMRTIASRALLGFAAAAVLGVSGYAAYKLTAGQKQDPVVASALPTPAPQQAAQAKPQVPVAPIAAPAPPAQQAPSAPVTVPTQELTQAQRAIAGQSGPLPAQLAKPPAPAPLPPIESVRPVDAPPPQPPAAAAPPKPALQVGPISTRLAQITCRPRSGGGEPATLLISAGIWQAAASFNSATDDVAKWTGQQNGMVLFDSNGRPDLAKIGPNLAVLAYANPGEQVASANDANAKAWVVVSKAEMKDADLGACTMRVIAPN